ncbi:hypothetical protein T10_6539 [Trichinella papuae]|uniref:Uncharacterized protein n=1 Tax=Trichinella papuae TaxID=268474 RepID=A0A0V1N6G6_9BILA|nr:hypothetical protein T10_6539 [Trichinella papuae]
MKLVETPAYGPLNPLQTTLSLTTLHNISALFFSNLDLIFAHRLQVSRLVMENIYPNLYLALHL